MKLIEVGTQTEIEGYTIAEFAEYLEKRTNEHKVLNLISLEFSSLPLNTDVQQPRMVKSIDWIDNVWPIDRRTKFDYPQVQKYCLTGMAGSYTDFHIDFGGTSVWYHVVTGKKRFFLIAPTIANLCTYEKWTCSASQDSTFFGDLVPNQCFYIDLCAGQTMLIPSVWIHSVYTPEDSLVFGGNFLHSYSIFRQLQANTIEDRTRVNKIYRFPFFRQISFYALTYLLKSVSKLTNEYDRSKLREITYMDVFGSEAVYRQFPYLLKSCEMWLSTSSLEDNERFSEAAVEAGIETREGVVAFWWEVLIQLAKNEVENPIPSTQAQGGSDIAHETFSDRFGAFLSHVQDIKNSPTMPDVLSEENANKALTMVEMNIPWRVLYQEAMKSGAFRKGCDKPNPVAFKSADKISLSSSLKKTTADHKSNGMIKGDSYSSSSSSSSFSSSTASTINREHNTPIDSITPLQKLASQLHPCPTSDSIDAVKCESPQVQQNVKEGYEEHDKKGGQYGTRGKRLSTSFLRVNTDVDITSEGEDDWKSCPIWSKQIINKKQRYLSQLQADAQREEDAFGNNDDEMDDEEEEDGMIDEQEDEEGKYLRKAAKRSRAPPPDQPQYTTAAASSTSFAFTAPTALQPAKKKPTTIRQNIKKLMKRKR